MTPETEKLIAEYPDLTVEEAKLIFIRTSAGEAYAKGNLEEATKDILKEVVKTATASSMSNEEVGQLIGDLEKARSFLAAFTQGISKAHADKVEPELKAKRKREQLEKKKATKKKKASDMLALMAAAEEDASVFNKPNTKKVEKVKCDKCGKEVYSLKFHKC